jgi:TatD DNase family protein
MGGRIMSIHSRRACRDVLNYLSSFPGAGVPVLHWFSGSLSELDIAIRLGCWFSVGPAMLCHQKGRLLIENMPYDRVITETDGPFVQYQENSILPWDVSSISTNIAKLWNMSTPNVDEIFHQNYMHLSM